MKIRINKPLRWALGVVLALATVAALATAVGTVLGLQRATRVLDIAVAPIAVPTGAEALARGKYLYESRGCADCHGAAGAGRSFVDAPGLHLAGPDISPGGVTQHYRPEDWVRSVRHGVAPGGRPLRTMPSQDYNRLTDIDLGAIVAYVKSMPAGSGAPARIELPLPARLAYGFGLLPDAAALIDHRLPPSVPVPEAPTAEHGRYVAQSCIGCHGPALTGGRIPGAPPDWPAAADLGPGASRAMARYTDAAAFIAMMRSGQRPDGSRIAVMPFEAFSKANDTDLLGLYAYLKTLPAQPAGGG